MYFDFIPTQKIGTSTDFYQSRFFNDADDASDFFPTAEENALHITNWNKYCTLSYIHFNHLDSHNKPVNRRLHKGDYIHIVNTGSFAVLPQLHFRISKLEYDLYEEDSKEAIAITLMLTNSANMDKPEENTSYTIVIYRDVKEITISCHGRNITPVDIMQTTDSKDFQQTLVNINSLMTSIINGIIR